MQVPTLGASLSEVESGCPVLDAVPSRQGWETDNLRFADLNTSRAFSAGGPHLNHLKAWVPQVSPLRPGMWDLGDLNTSRAFSQKRSQPPRPTQTGGWPTSEPPQSLGAPGLASETWDVGSWRFEYITSFLGGWPTSEPPQSLGAPGLASETWDVGSWRFEYITSFLGGWPTSEPPQSLGAPGLASETWDVGSWRFEYLASFLAKALTATPPNANSIGKHSSV